jgi:hypothetical protein
MKVAESQLEICRRYGAECSAPALDSKLGISDNFFSGELPLNGLRHPPEGDTCGWYLWAGELSNAPDFFKPLHVFHLIDRNAAMGRFLGLPPGWRFLIGDKNHEDAWFDRTLLEV